MDGEEPDQGRLHLRLAALALERKLPVQHVGGDEPEHGVAEELERLVVADHVAIASGVFVGA